MRAWIALAFLFFLPVAASAQQATSNGAPTTANTTQGTIAQQTCSSPSGAALSTTNGVTFATGTLTNAGDVVSIVCPNINNYEVTINPNGATPITGTLQAFDPLSNVNRALFKAGVGELDVSSVAMTGLAGQTAYRMCGSNGIGVSLPAVTSGSGIVKIFPTAGAGCGFQNNPVHSAAEGALRNSRAFTASTGFQQVAVGSSLILSVVNPAGSATRVVIPPEARIIGCNNPSSALLPNYASAINATSGVPTTTAAVTRRGGNGVTAPVATATSGVSTTTPQTTPATTNFVGLPFFGSFPVPQDRTLEPGQSLAIWVQGVAIPTGLGTTNPSCSIIMSWYEEVEQ